MSRRSISSCLPKRQSASAKISRWGLDLKPRGSPSHPWCLRASSAWSAIPLTIGSWSISTIWRGSSPRKRLRTTDWQHLGSLKKACTSKTKKMAQWPSRSGRWTARDTTYRLWTAWILLLTRLREGIRRQAKRRHSFWGGGWLITVFFPSNY